MSNKLKLKVRTKLPAALVGRTGIAVAKDGLTYNLDLDYSRIVQTSQFDPVNDLFAVWNKATGVWNTINPASFVSGSFYSAVAASQTVPDGVSLVAIQRTSPSATALTLPLLANQGGKAIVILDWSTSVTSHAITITPSGGATIMQAASKTINSSASQAVSVILYPSLDLNGWYIAPLSTFLQAGTGAVSRSFQDKARDFVSVKDFGAIGDGVADDTAAIINAINSVPASGGEVFFPRGTYKITSQLTMGDATSTTASTKSGIVLRGEGMPMAGGTGQIPSTVAGTRLLWGNASVGNMVVFAGAMDGWGVHNLCFDGNNVAGNGLYVVEGSFGDCSNLLFKGITSASLTTTTRSPNPSSTNSMHNMFRNLVFIVPPVNGAIGILQDGAPGGGNSCYNTFINTTFDQGTAHVNTTAIYLRYCDNISFFMTHMFNGPLAKSVVFDYTVDSNFPSCCSFYHMDPVGAGGPEWSNIGTPNSGMPNGGPLYNWCYGLSTGNGALPPAPLANFTYISTFQIGGSQSNDAAVVGAVGETIAQQIALGSAVSLTSGTAANVSGFTLSPGDWDVSAMTYFRTGAATVCTTFMSSVSSTSGVIETTPGQMGRINYPGSTLGVVDTTITIASFRVSLAAPLAIFHTALATFSGGTNSVYGVMRARRMR